MPAILGFVAILFLVYLAVCMLIPTVASVLATMFLGKTAKLEFEEIFLLSVYFYLIQWAFVGIIFIQENEPETWWGMILYFIGGIFWPIPYSLMLFGQTNNSGMAFALLGCTFVITQLIAVIMILKKAKRRTSHL